MYIETTMYMFFPQWDLVCDYAWVTGMASTIFFFGRFVGAFVVGILSDK